MGRALKRQARFGLRPGLGLSPSLKAGPRAGGRPMQNEKFWLVNIYAWGQNTYKINKGTRDNENVAKK